MSTNPLLIEMLARRLQSEYFEAAEAERLIRQAERAQTRRRGRLFAALTRFLTPAEHRRQASHPAR